MNDKIQPDDKDIALLLDADTRQPDKAVDNAIRQMAADAVADDQTGSSGISASPKRRHIFRFTPMIATAAVALLAVGIVPLMLESPQQPIPYAINDSEISADFTSNVVSSEISTDSAVGVTSGLAAQKASAPAAKMSRSVTASNGIAAAGNASARLAAEEQEMSSMMLMEADSVEAKSARSVAGNSILRQKTQREAESSSLTQAAQLSPEKWIDQINKLFDNGDIDAAKKQLLEFRAQFKNSEFENRLRSGLTQQ